MPWTIFIVQAKVCLMPEIVLGHEGPRMNVDLSNLAAALGVISAAFWFYSALSVSREKELARRKQEAKRKRIEPNLGGIQILDDEHRYDLIATLRHQSRFSKCGAIFAALTLVTQALDKYV
jgi:hypothetical protein